MGASSSTPLRDLTVEQVAAAVDSKGPKFGAYAEAIRENAVDGSLLDSMGEDVLVETLDDLDITNRLHKRILTKDWKEAKDSSTKATTVRNASLPRQQQQGTALSKEEMEREATKRSLLAAAAKYPSLLVPPFKEPSEEVRRALFRAVAEYDLSVNTPPEELITFDEIATKALKDCNASYAGIHLLDEDGHVSISSRYFLGEQDGDEPKTKRWHVPKGVSQCYAAILGEGTDSITKTIKLGGHPFRGHEKEAEYNGHVIKSARSERIGMVCTITEPFVDHAKKEQILKKLAEQAEHQLQLRKVLVNRMKALQEQIDRAQIQSESKSDIVLPAYGPLKPVTAAEVGRRKSYFPMPDEIAASGKRRRSAALPCFHEDHASPEEMMHLPADYWSVLDELGADRTPINKNDIERIAVVEALSLHELPPSHPTAGALKKLTALGAHLFNVAHVMINLLDHEKQMVVAQSFNCSEEYRQKVFEFLEPMTYESDGTTPFVCAMGRGHAVCNYPVHTRRTFTVHDIWEDYSFQWLREADAFRFYSGSPLTWNGYVIGTLCLFDTRARPDFTKAHEIQEEQLAQLVVQQIDTWSIRCEMETLEKERTLLSSHRQKAAPPKDQAALVFTDIQGSTALWESDSQSMSEALLLHDRIMRRNIAKCHGYEVITEGDAFLVSFHDAVDALQFALKTQEDLHNAVWSESILQLPDACDDGKAFRGLRVRMAVHYGSVTCRDNEVSGRREYTGPTVNIAKSLESMCYGGQVLVTTDVWNVASYVAETSLGSPQVIDLGMHVLWTGKAQNEGAIAKSVIQVVPLSLAYDYAAYSGHSSEKTVAEYSKKDSVPKGRRFPPPRTKRRLSASFHDAPHSNKEVTMVFIYTSEVEKLYNGSSNDISLIMTAIANLVGALVGRGPGYQCKNFMVAFPNTSEAVAFGLSLQEHLRDNAVAGVSLSGLLQVGLHHGEFTSMCPNPTSGRADFFGRVVNRAARVASATEPGKVFLGTFQETQPDLGDGMDSELVCWKELKGVQGEMALYSCRRA